MEIIDIDDRGRGRTAGIRGLLLASSAISMAWAPFAFAAQSPATSALPEQVFIQAPLPGGYSVDVPSLSKLTEPLLNTPQSIDAISQQELEDRAATNLNDALRNVPGISLGAGEFMWQGNNPSIRGFVARNNMFLDGMRDFGNYYRDPFDLGQIEVLEGPSSILFGRGSTGGVINQVSKVPETEPLLAGTVAFGTDLTRRATADIDQPVTVVPGAAFRLNLMGDQGDVAGRDGAKVSRYGYAPSLALGLGTDTRALFSSFHQSANDVPDYGLPWYFGKPPPVARQNFYGFSDDYLDTTADIATIRIEHDFTPDITLRDQFRDADYTRMERLTQATLPGSTTPTTPLAGIMVNRAIYGGHSQEQMVENQLELLGRFDSGFLRQDVVAGGEVSRERSAPEFDNGLNVSAASLLDPGKPVPFTGSMFERFHADTRANTAGIYALDTLKFGSQWQVMLGWRWDMFDVMYRSQTFSVPPAALGNIVASNNRTRDVETPSYRAAILYKPADNGSVYVMYGTSFDPSAESLTLLTSGESFQTSNEFLAPEKNCSYEAGTKWQLLGNRLSASLAVFRLETANAPVPDPDNPGFNILDGLERVDGVEMLAEGRITDNWQISGGYDYLDGTIVKSSAAGPAPGSPLTNTPRNSFTVWTTYELPFGLVIGGGLHYLDSRVAQNTKPIETAPAYWTFDAMAKYPLTANMALQLNVYNLTNAYYYDQLHPHFVIPGAGRSALLTLEFNY